MSAVSVSDGWSELSWRTPSGTTGTSDTVHRRMRIPGLHNLRRRHRHELVREPIKKPRWTLVATIGADQPGMGMTNRVMLAQGEERGAS